MFYIINLLIILFYAYLTRRISKKNCDINFLILAWIHLILIMGLRKETVGTDSQMYINLYRIIVNGGITSLNNKAPLYVSFLKISNNILGDGNQVYFFATGIVTITFTLLAINVLKLDVRKSVLLYYLMFFLTSLNATRNYMAVSMVFAGYALGIKANKKIFKFIGLALIIAAILIHSSAIIGIPIFFSSLFDFSKKKTRRWAAFVALSLVLGYRYFIELFIKLFPVYSNTIEMVQDQVGASALVFQLCIFISFVQAIYISKKNLYTKGILSKNVFFSIMFLLGVEIGMYLIGGDTWYFQRFIVYIEILSIPFFINNNTFKNRYGQIAKFSFLIVIWFCFVYRIIRNLGAVSPYLFFWQ